MTWKRLILGVLLLGTSIGQASTLGFLKPFAQQRQTLQSTPSGAEIDVLHAERTSFLDGVLELEGGVKIRYKEYDLSADRVKYISQTETFELIGDATITSKSDFIEGAYILLDGRRNVIQFRSSTARLTPDQTGSQVRGPVYFKGDGGLGSKSLIKTLAGSITTCDLEDSHYALEADRTETVPGKVIRLWNVRLKVLGRTILSIPFLAIPLTENSQRYVPEVGQSPDEGLYAKFKFSTQLKGDSYLDHSVDLMEKLGVGLGTQLNYLNPRMEGEVGAYTLFGSQPSKRFQLEHRQALGGGELSIGGNLQQSDYLTAPSSTNSSLRGQYLAKLWGGQSRLSFTRTASQTSGFSSASEGFSLNDSRSWKSWLRSSLTLNMSSNNSKGDNFSSASRRLDVNVNTNAEFRSFSADLLYQRAVPISGASRIGSGDRTPLLTLKTNSSKLFDRARGIFPWNAEASIGELFEVSSQRPITRIFFGFDGRERLRIGPAQLNVGGEFRQGVYSDGTAQYGLLYDGRLGYEFLRNSSININYRRQAFFGFTPLSLDRGGRADALNADLTYAPLRSLKIFAQTGYDVQQSSQGLTPWQTLSFRSEWNPRGLSKVKASSFYDTFSQVWSTIQLESEFSVLGARWGLGARYDGRRRQWASVSLVVDGLSLGKVRTSALFDYNGYTRMLESMHLSFAMDLHCNELVFELIDSRAGFRAGTQFAVYFRIKAFPTFSPFGRGTRGQAVGSGFGFGG